MKNVWKLLILFLFPVIFLFSLLIFDAKSVNAQALCSFTYSPTSVLPGATINVNIAGPASNYRVRIFKQTGLQQVVLYDQTSSQNNVTAQIPTSAQPDTYSVDVQIPQQIGASPCASQTTGMLTVQSTSNVDCSKADINNDGKIDSQDQQLIGLHFPPAPFEAIYDITGDGKIDTNDTAAVFSCEPSIGSGAGANPCTSTECPTALGNLPITLKSLAEKVLQIGIGLAGGIALILMVVGAIRILISSGDQQKLNGGREMMVAAIAGLLFLLFATLILQFIGISILRGVPGIGA